MDELPAEEKPTRIYAPPPPTDPVHGTDCPAWYLWAEQHADDVEFHTLFHNRRESINRKGLGPDFDAFLLRLNTEDIEAEKEANLLESAYQLIDAVEGEQPEVWRNARESWRSRYNGKIPDSPLIEPVPSSSPPAADPSDADDLGEL